MDEHFIQLSQVTTPHTCSLCSLLVLQQSPSLGIDLGNLNIILSVYSWAHTKLFSTNRSVAISLKSFWKLVKNSLLQEMYHTRECEILRGRNTEEQWAKSLRQLLHHWPGESHLASQSHSFLIFKIRE